MAGLVTPEVVSTFIQCYLGIPLSPTQLFLEQHLSPETICSKVMLLTLKFPKGSYEQPQHQRMYGLQFLTESSLKMCKLQGKLLPNVNKNHFCISDKTAFF